MSYLHRKAANLFGRLVRWRRSSQNTTNRSALCIIVQKAEYGHFLIDMKKDLQRSLMLADAAGIARDQIILDPGVGFGKTYEQNLAVLAHLDTFLDFELPLLLATSRKSVIGLTLDLPVEEREEGTMVTSVLAALNHWDMVRVHDVEKNVRALRMTEKIMSLQ